MGAEGAQDVGDVGGGHVRDEERDGGVHEGDVIAGFGASLMFPGERHERIVHPSGPGEEGDVAHAQEGVAVIQNLIVHVYVQNRQTVRRSWIVDVRRHARSGAGRSPPRRFFPNVVMMLRACTTLLIIILDTVIRGQIRGARGAGGPCRRARRPAGTPARATRGACV